MAETKAKKSRPVWYNLNLMHLPLPGWVSILHRGSGLLLFLSIPLMLFGFDLSLGREESFASVKGVLAMPVVKLALIAVIWAVCHHLCAGIRFLFLDIHRGTELATARTTSRVVLGVSLLMTAILAVKIW